MTYYLTHITSIQTRHSLPATGRNNANNIFFGKQLVIGHRLDVLLLNVLSIYPHGCNAVWDDLKQRGSGKLCALLAYVYVDMPYC